MTFQMAYLALMYFCGLTLDLKPREVINPFPDLYFFLNSKYVIFIFSGLSIFNEMSKVTYLILPLIYLCFLTLRRPHFFMFTVRNNFFLTCKLFLPEHFPSWATMINRRSCYNLLEFHVHINICITKLWALGSYFLYLSMFLLHHFFHSEQLFFNRTYSFCPKLNLV